MKIFVLLFAAIFICKVARSANILAVIPSPFYSHQATYRPIWRELAKRGHKITLITTDLMEDNENITQIDFSGTYELFERIGIKDVFVKNFSLSNIVNKILEIVDTYYTYQFTHPGLVELMEKNAKFDLLFVEVVIPYWNSLSYKFNAPYIGLTTMDAPPRLHGEMGNAMHPALYPITEMGFEVPLNFKERFLSTLLSLVWRMFSEYLSSSIGNELIRKYIAKDCPDNAVLERNASMIFVNANPIFFRTRPITPTTINLEGGLHLGEPKALPKDLQTFLDESKDGCIYFSLGSTVKSNELGPEILDIFRKTFEELSPMRILWKFENETLPNKPKNLEIRKWLPQQDVLRHPNIKLFINQGGLQSMEEAIDSAVPMLGIPFYGDQINNVNKMVTKEFGMKLDIHTLEQKTLKNTILELLNNPLYRKNAQKYSKIQKDRPMSAVEKAVWWTEYVLRHGGTTHLRSPSADIPLYQYFFLDIIAFVSAVFIFFILIIYYSFRLIRFIFRKVFKCRSKKHKEKTN